MFDFGLISYLDTLLLTNLHLQGLPPVYPPVPSPWPDGQCRGPPDRPQHQEEAAQRSFDPQEEARGQEEEPPLGRPRQALQGGFLGQAGAAVVGPAGALRGAPDLLLLLPHAQPGGAVIQQRGQIDNLVRCSLYLVFFIFCLDALEAEHMFLRPVPSHTDYLEYLVPMLILS